MVIYKIFNFEAAHALPNVPDGHQCKGIHGHSYEAKIHVSGDLDPELGWLIDFADIKKIVKPIIDQLDHTYINDIEGLENPTCEHIAIWIWDHIKQQLPQLQRIELKETPTSGVIYEG